MYNNPYVINGYNSQSNVDRINNQIAELEKMKQQMQQPMTPTPAYLVSSPYQSLLNTGITNGCGCGNYYGTNII